MCPANSQSGARVCKLWDIGCNLRHAVALYRHAEAGVMLALAKSVFSSFFFEWQWESREHDGLGRLTGYFLLLSFLWD